jgi:hypothetical protein
MKRIMISALCMGLLCCVMAGCQNSSPAGISGELKKWHKITLAFQGPETTETAEPNPFLNYRLDVTFTHDESGTTYLVPGYFAADGNAANSGAETGNTWLVHFRPDETGTWQYQTFFRQGENIVAENATGAGASAGFMDGATGSFDIGDTDKTGRDLRAKGRLQYVGGHYLQFAETRDFFLKCGADAPENFLAYADFDGDFQSDGQKDNLVKDWAPHVPDWKDGDPAWQNGKGKGMIGAINYLASKGMNVFSFLTMNIGGDDRNVYPYISTDDVERLDVSKLAQWEVVFDHAETLGMYLHFKTQETENECLLDNGNTGVQRKLYYRELIARFGHHLALNWNLGEENGMWNAGKKKHFQTTTQRRAMAQYLYDTDPYHHLIVNHNGQSFEDLLGSGSRMTGASVQTNQPDFSRVHSSVLRWIRDSEAAGKPWVVTCDEPGDAQHSLVTDDENPTHDNARKNALWGTFMAGGAGIEWYFGYKHPHSDLTCQDYRSRDAMWDQGRYALDFFRNHKIPVNQMTSNDDLVPGDDDYGFVKPGSVYCFYLKQGGRVQLQIESGSFEYGWFNPRTGEGGNMLLDQKQASPGRLDVTAPDDNDWVLLIRGQGVITSAANQTATVKSNRVFEEIDGVVAVEAEHFTWQTQTDARQWYIQTARQSSAVAPDGDDNHAKLASGRAYVEILPDTRRTHDDKLVNGKNFTNTPGVMGVLHYPIWFNTTGRYYVWARTFSTGSEDNGLHVGIDGQWPESGQRLQWCEGKQFWQWDSKQRTEAVHCGEPYKIYLDIEKSGLHTIMFSMREDGFEFDKFLMTTDRDFVRPTNPGPAEKVR